MNNNIFQLIPPAAIGHILKITRQRAHIMCHNPEAGKNRERVNGALKIIKEEIEKYLAG